jgi:hypothetical protein
LKYNFWRQNNIDAVEREKEGRGGEREIIIIGVRGGGCCGCFVLSTEEEATAGWLNERRER